MILDALRLFFCLNRIVTVKVTGFYDRVHYFEITGQKGSPKCGRLNLNLHTLHTDVLYDNPDTRAYSLHLIQSI